MRGGPDLTYNGGTSNFPDDAFVAKVNPAGTALVYAGYIGGADARLGQQYRSGRAPATPMSRDGPTRTRPLSPWPAGQT